MATSFLLPVFIAIQQCHNTLPKHFLPTIPLHQHRRNRILLARYIPLLPPHPFFFFFPLQFLLHPTLHLHRRNRILLARSFLFCLYLAVYYLYLYPFLFFFPPVFLSLITLFPIRFFFFSVITLSIPQLPHPPNHHLRNKHNHD
ncbi:hypothetical protein BM1_05589 [Bipolaris maydis]|nr:hypothetical protein BM1_05589 [Bipolaris maydis]